MGGGAGGKQHWGKQEGGRLGQTTEGPEPPDAAPLACSWKAKERAWQTGVRPQGQAGPDLRGHPLQRCWLWELHSADPVCGGPWLSFTDRLLPGQPQSDPHGGRGRG